MLIHLLLTVDNWGKLMNISNSETLTVRTVTRNESKKTAGVDGEIWSTAQTKIRSSHDACEQMFTCLCNKHSAQWILKGNIKGCFDKINHQWLINNILREGSVRNQFLKAVFVSKDHLNPKKIGTLREGIISPIMRNIALDSIEHLLFTKYNTGKSEKDNSIVRCQNEVNFVRYADDFVVTASSEELVREIKELISAFLKKRSLELSEEKTLITHIDYGFDFLGWNFRKHEGKLQIKIAREHPAESCRVLD